MNPEKHSAFFRLIEALRSDGCPICRICEDLDKKYVDDFFYESVNDPGLRARLERSLGFGELGARLAQAQADGLGMSIILADLCRALIGRLGAGDLALKRAADCVVMEHHFQTEKTYLAVFASHCQDEEVWQAHAAGLGFCLHHLRLCLPGLPEPGRERLLQAEQEHLKRLESRMRALVDRSRADSTATPTPAEHAAWREALRKFFQPDGRR